MGLEFGKWLLDIAKYMLMALLLANVFGDMGSPVAIIEVVVAIALCLGIGLYLIKRNNIQKKGKK